MTPVHRKFALLLSLLVVGAVSAQSEPFARLRLRVRMAPREREAASGEPFVSSPLPLSTGGEGRIREPLPPRAMQRYGTTKLRHGSRIQCLLYSHDGETLVAGGGSDPLRLWNPKTCDVIREFNDPGVQAIAFTPSGETLLYGGAQRVIKLWNFRLKRETGRLDGHKATVKAIAVAPDTSTIVSGSQDGAICVWDMNTKSKSNDLVGHTDEVNALVYFADPENNAFLISGGNDRRIIVWNMNVEPPVAKLKFDAGAGVHALAISTDGKTLYSAGDDNLIRRWNVADGKQTGTFKGHGDLIVSLVRRGDTLISGSIDKTVRFWNAKTTKQLRSLTRSAGDCDALAVTEPQKIEKAAAEPNDFLAVAGFNNTIRIFAADNLKEVIPEPGIQAPLVGLALAPNNRRFATVSADGKISLWAPSAEKPQIEWDCKQTGDILLAFAGDNKTLASASTSARLWNADTGIEIGQAALSTGEPIVALAFSPDGKLLALGSEAGHIELWDVKGKARAGSFKYPGPLHAVAWSPDGKSLAAAGAAKIFVWNPRTGALVRAFDLQDGITPILHTIHCLAFGPEGNTLATGWFDGGIRIYHLDAKNPADPHEQERCEGNQSTVNALAFSPDGRSLVSGSFDRTVRLWEAFSGKQIASFNGHVGEVTGVAFSNDGLTAFSAGTDTVAYRWDVPGMLKGGKLPELTLTAQELNAAWKTLLTEETAVGHETMWRCIASGRQAVPHLTTGKKLYLIDPARVKKLFRDLDSSNYPVRKAAMNELAGFGRWMEGRCETAMRNPSSLEYKRRVELLKEKLSAGSTPSLAQERLRLRRIMLMCEQVGGPDAIDALRQLADRGPEEDIRAEAAGSLRRLKK